MSKRILTVQDISCVGQCSLTVALPIISACGVECSVLPSAVLSTHTAGFTGYTFRDLTEDIPAIIEHWKKEKLSFDAIYTGYLGSQRQIDLVKELFSSCLLEGGLKIVDPAMADNGQLYPAFDMNYARAMGSLCSGADAVLPNITEAAFMTGLEYRDTYDEAYIEDVLDAVIGLGAKTAVLTGVSYRKGFTGVAVKKAGEETLYYEHEKMPQGKHGTGDVYASAFTGGLVRGLCAFDAAKVAADYTLECIKAEDSRFYGVSFEPLLGKLIEGLDRALK